MYALEQLHKIIKTIAAKTHGQVGGVRTVQGRQLIFMKESTPIMLLPNIQADDLMVPSGANLGKFYSMVDVDPVDSPNAVIK